MRDRQVEMHASAGSQYFPDDAEQVTWKLDRLVATLRFGAVLWERLSAISADVRKTLH